MVLHCPCGPCGVNPLRLVPFENAVSDGIYAVLLGFGYGRKAVLVGHDDQPIYRTAGFLCRNDCFVKDRVGSRLEIVGIGRFLLRVLYSVLIGPFDVVFHLSVECTVLVRYIGLHINFLNRRYPASVFDGGSFVRDDRERRLFGSYFFQFARRNRAGDENQK